MKPDYTIKILKEIIKIVEKEPQITTVIFDLGDTLCLTLDPEKWEIKRDREQLDLIKAKHTGVKINFEEYLEKTKIILEMINKERGETLKEITFKGFARKILKNITGKIDKNTLQQFCDIQYRYGLKKTYLKSHALSTLKKLKEKGYKLGVITNTWHDKERIYRKLDELKIKFFFDSVIVSGEIGIFKPNPLIFKKSLRELRNKAEEVIFVGNDLRADVYGAKKFGIRVILIK